MAELPRDLPGEALEAWLATTPEDAIDPGQPIIDPHHHLWDRRPRPNLPAGSRQHLRYLADDLIEDIRGGGHDVFDTVFIECIAMYREERSALRSVGETEFVQGVHAMAASGLYGAGVRCCGAIISFVDLTQGSAAGEILDAHIAAGRNFRGIRHAHGWHESPDMPDSHHPTRGTPRLLADADFRAGFAELNRRGLVFDCWGYHGQLDEVADLAAAYPSTPIVLDHIGGPIAKGPYEGKRTTTLFDEWRAAIERVAKQPNVIAKVGGCGMVTYGFGYEQADQAPSSAQMAADWRPYFEHVIECFSPARSMFESNFPVDKLSCSYTNLWNACKLIAGDLSLTDEERNDLFYGTAARTYKIALSDERNAAISAPANG